MTDFDQPASVPTDPNEMPMKGGRYFDPASGETYQRVTNLLKFVKGDTYTLDMWKGRMIARGLASRPDLLALAASLTEDDKDKMNAVVSDAMTAGGADSGRNKGTALHRVTERLDRGEHFDNLIAGLLPHDLADGLRAYRDLVHSAGFIRVPEMVERTVANPAQDYAGTLDRAWYFRSQDGELSIVDAKTEKNPDNNGVHLAGQLALYANATHIWQDGRLVPLDEAGIRFNRKVGYVIHVRDGRARLIAVDLAAGLRVAIAALNVRALHYAARSFLMEMPVTITAPPAAELVSAAVAEAREDAQQLMNLALSDSPVAGALLDAADQAGVLDATEHVEASSTYGPTDSGGVRDMLLAEIRAADGTPRLAELYEIAQGYPGLWAAVEIDAMLRGQIVGCKQRAMHNPATTGRCACGWTPEHRA